MAAGLFQVREVSSLSASWRDLGASRSGQSLEHSAHASECKKERSQRQRVAVAEVGTERV